MTTTIEATPKLTTTQIEEDAIKDIAQKILAAGNDHSRLTLVESYAKLIDAAHTRRCMPYKDRQAIDAADTGSGA